MFWELIIETIAGDMFAVVLFTTEAACLTVADTINGYSTDTVAACYPPE